MVCAEDYILIGGGLDSYREVISYPPEYEAKSFQIIRNYHDGMKKVIAMNYPPVALGTKRDKTTFKSYDRKLYNSISRSTQTINELAKCNRWTYFVTLTIDPKKHDPCNHKGFMKKFSKWLCNYSDQKLGEGNRIEYILVPEISKRGRWHLHGLMKGLPRKHLSKFVEGKHPQYLVDGGMLNWKAYGEKFGFCWFDKVGGSQNAMRYATKKITKSFETQMRGLGERLYYCSKGLNRSEEIDRGYNLIPIDDYDFENEWVGIKWIHDM